MAPDVTLKQTLDGTFWTPTWLKDDLRSFKYFRKTALTLFLWIARRGWCSLSSSLLIQHSRILKNKVNHSSKQGPPPFFHSDTNPVLGNVLVHSVKKKHILVVTVQLAWFLFLNILFSNFFQSGHIPLFYFSLMIYFSCICRNFFC